MTFKTENHGPWRLCKPIGRQYCAGCGLIKLNNEFTAWCIKNGCNHTEHPSYETKRKQCNQRSSH